MSNKLGFLRCLAVVVLATGIIGGCNVTVTPPPEAVLQGNWLLATPDSNESNGDVFVFDGVGHLVEIRHTTGKITVVEKDPHRETKVTGSSVRIVTNANLIFEGTFNDTMNVINGHLQSEVDVIFTNTTIITDLGAATFTKQ